MPRKETKTDTPDTPEAITGIEAFQGKGIQSAKGFWEDAFEQLLRRPLAVFGVVWIAIVGFFAVFSPLLANGHPLLMWNLDEQGNRTDLSSPLLASLNASDWMLIIGTIAGTAFFFAPLPIKRSRRILIIVLTSIQAGLIAILCSATRDIFNARDVSDWMREFESWRVNLPILGNADAFALTLVAVFGLPISALFAYFLPFEAKPKRIAVAAGVFILSAIIIAPTSAPGLNVFDYNERETNGQIEAVYTIVPWSPSQRVNDRKANFLPPGGSTGSALASKLTVRMPRDAQLPPDAVERTLTAARALPLPEEQRNAFVDDYTDFLNASPPPTRNDITQWATERLTPLGVPYPLGTNSFGEDVLSQMLHASRLSISIGLVSTGIAVFIGVFMGALMGYFGGWVDLVLYRITEIFMAIPVLFLLIVAAAVLPKNTYVMMAIIGCFTWHSAARFTRAEFLRLRNQDFVQSANAVGLPLTSVLFKHMLPNGVTPVLVDASFRIALAILFESILSFLGLGPVEQPSWGKLLSDATAEAGNFIWWLAIFPGLAIFLTVLAYNLIGEALRDAIDPKLKKARV